MCPGVVGGDASAGSSRIRATSRYTARVLDNLVQFGVRHVRTHIRAGNGFTVVNGPGNAPLNKQNGLAALQFKGYLL